MKIDLAQLEAWRKDTIQTVESKIRLLAAHAAGLPRDVRRFYIEPKMEALHAWRERLEQPATGNRA